MIKKVLYALGVLAVVLGIYGFFNRLTVGEQAVNYGSYVTWGLWVAMYLFLAGIATGAFMIASLDYLFGIAAFKGTGRVALWTAIVTMPAALMSIGMDLGHMERIWKVYLNPNFNSVMAQLVWGYTVFTLLTIVSLVIVWKQGRSPLLKVVMGVGLFLAVFLSGGVGALLGVNASRASWHNAMLPAQFPIFNLTSGVAVMLLIIGFFGIVSGDQRRQVIRILAITLTLLLLVKAYFLWVDYSQALYSGIPQNVEAVNLVLFGPYWWAFWIVQVGLGMVIPALLLIQPRWSRNNLVAGSMGLLVLIGLAVARTNIIFPALSVPELEGLATAFSGPHLNFDYFPSLVEWSVTVGVVGLATLAFLIGIDLFVNRTTRTEVIQ